MIYVDNASTTKISDNAFEKMLPFLREQYGNASSHYSLGAKAKRAIELARKQVAVAIGAEPSEITFTSSGSEANSWVLIPLLSFRVNSHIGKIGHEFKSLGFFSSFLNDRQRAFSS